MIRPPKPECGDKRAGVCKTEEYPNKSDASEKKHLSTELVATSESWDGKVLPSYPVGVPRVTILRITIAPSERLPMHRHPVINAGVVLQGELTVVTEGGVSKTFTTGDAIVELTNTFHYGENRGTKPVDLVMFYAGTADTPLSESK